MSHSWMQTLRTASYRGAHFWVERDQVETGRRLVVHEFPLRDAPYVEDMGRSANKVQVTAYVVGDGAGGEASTLRRACEAGGAASLVLPLERFTAHCQKCSRDFTKDKLGYVAFSLDFVLEGGGAAPFPTSFLARMAAVAVPPLAAAAISQLRSGYAALGHAAWVSAEASDEISAIAGAIDAARLDVTLVPAAGTRLAAAIRDTIRLAPSLAQSGESPDRWRSRDFMARARVADPGVIAERIFEHTTALQASGPPDDVVRALEPLTAWDQGATPRATARRSRSAARAWANRQALARVTRLAAIAATVVALTEREYADRRTAIQARADIAELIDREMLDLAGPEHHAAHVALAELRRRAIDYLSRALIDLAPIRIVESGAVLPSLYWSQVMYGSADRAGELARLNGTFHPGFMPQRFEARL